MAQSTLESAAPSRMAKMLLECPQCDTRFQLRKYVVDKRVRCRKCKAIFFIPPVRELLSPEERARYLEAPIDPEVQKKVARILSLRKLLVAAGLVVVAVVAAGWWLINRTQAPRVVEAPAPPPKVFDAAALAAQNKFLEYPMGLGWEWYYQAGVAAEECRVVSASKGLGGEPQFIVVSSGPQGIVRQTILITATEAVILDEVVGDTKHRYSPPLPFVKFPLYENDTWTYRGTRIRDGGGEEVVELEFRVAIETLDKLPIGKVPTSRVTCTGSKAGIAVNEIVWYVKGKGIVQRQSNVNGQTVTRVITRYVQK